WGTDGPGVVGGAAGRPRRWRRASVPALVLVQAGVREVDGDDREQGHHQRQELAVDPEHDGDGDERGHRHDAESQLLAPAPHRRRAVVDRYDALAVTVLEAVLPDLLLR